jgi:uncharacterized protein YdeI (YjbR/CyaY-like superfamily)
VKNPEVDAYIEAAAPFARPILQRIRATFHGACPEVTEALKWRQPFFLYRGKMLAVMGAFKSHVRFHFIHGSAQPDPHGLFRGDEENEAGALKLSTVEELPTEEVLAGYIQRAIEHQEKGGKREPAGAKTPKPALTVPSDFREALRLRPAAKTAFAALSPSHQREYLEWILGAKREATREKRILTAVECLGEGKSLHWKYERK